jgi:hypothetical protein
VSNKRNVDMRMVGLSVLALLLLQIAPGGTAAQATPGQGQEDQVRRVIVLIPSRVETTTPQTQHGAEQAAAKIMSARRPRGRRRRRLFTLPGASRESAPSVPAVPVTRAEKTDSDPKSGRSEKTAQDERSSTGSAAKGGGKATADGRAAGSAKSKPPDTVPVQLRAALAQALFADMVAERVQERLGVAVVAQNEVNAALNALHLTPTDIENRGKPENGRHLCAYLRCQAILIPHVIQCEVKDGLTRDVTCYASVTVEKLAEKLAEKPTGKRIGNPAEKQSTGAARKPEMSGEGKLEPEGVSAARWPARLDVAGAASSPQVLFHQQYQKPQGDLIRDAAQQAASLFAHALRTGEQAPFMRPTDRLAVPPVFAPTRADKLMFTKTGRRVQPSATRGLDGNVSDLFTPDLLPLPPDRIIDASEILARAGLAHEQTKSAQWKDLENLWKNGKDETLPDVGRIQSLARRIGGDYVLLARITDVEVSEGAADPATLVSNTTPGEPERAVRVEAVAALVRVVDGTVQWQDRATSTTTAPLTAQNAAGNTSAERSLVHDAIRFALIELQRRLRHYRAGFEK